MTTELKAPLRRGVMIGHTPYTLTIDPGGFKLVEKGHRKGVEVSWKDLVMGDTALAIALQASLTYR